MKATKFILAHQQWLTVIVVLIIGRLLLSGYIPLMEFSEARYAEISRYILQTDDWVTLWFYTNEPFWGKPPLAFWSTAISYLAFGVNEFAARWSSFACTLATALILGLWTRRNIGRSESYAVSLIYLCSWLVLHSAGAVITDPLLTLTTTLVMISFWEAVAHERGHWAYIVWVALAAGLLAKGPLALVLCGAACGLWVLVYNQWKEFFRNIHLVSGLLLMLLLAIPWYYLAEQKTPGFFDYFIIGEHFERYTQSEWQGDPYGSVKDRPLGTIWIYFLIATLPWSPFVLARLFRRSTRQTLKETYDTDPHFYGYLVFWIITPLIFFTMAKNVLITYVLPVIPAFSVLLAKKFDDLVMPSAIFHRFSLAMTLVFFILSFGLFQFYFQDHRYNQKPMVMKYAELNATDPGDLVYSGARIFSPRFYTDGKVKYENDRDSYPKHDGTFYFAARQRWLDSYNKLFADRCTIEMQRVDFTLFYCPAINAEGP